MAVGANDDVNSTSAGDDALMQPLKGECGGNGAANPPVDIGGAGANAT